MKKYFIQTFWCEMNKADSEKINMLLIQSWFIKASEPNKADIVILNTCSVRQKWEDRVFGMIREIKKNAKKVWKNTIVWITWCMVRKTWVNIQYIKEIKERDRAKKIELLNDENEIFNNDDKLFPRIPDLDFTLRIEEIKYLQHILTAIFKEKIWSDDKFDDYLKSKQLRESKHHASIIIQTWCDNYCTFCIVPYTRWREISRTKEDIIKDCLEAKNTWAKEITLLGQNVNSYWKQFVDKKLWNEEKGKWNKKWLNIWVDLDDSTIKVWYNEIFENYNKKYWKNITINDLHTHNFNWDELLKNEFFDYYYKNHDNFEMYEWAKDILIKLKEDWNRLFILTSRTPEKDKDLTLKYLDNKFWKWFFEDIIFVKENWLDKKDSFVRKHSLDIVIDDAPHHITDYLKNTNCKILVFSQPWNKEFNDFKDKRINIIKSWNEIYNIISRIECIKSPFRELLEEVNKIEWIDRIRFTSSNPHDMTVDILDSHSELPNMCNYLHFALQSWSNEILKKMNRKHTYEDFKKQVDYLRSKDPFFSISTDIIVWFSGETDEMFEETVKAFEECQFDFAYIARYSVRPGTIASKLYPDNVWEDIKSKRWHILNKALMKSLQNRNEMMIWRTEKILISWEKDEQFYGRTRNFKEVFFDKDEKYKIWDILKVKILEQDKWVLKWVIS